MPELAPFAALRYTDEAGDLSLVLAPPYDVIEPEAAAALRARSPFNCVRLILPEGSETERYTNAAQTLRNWTSSGILATDPDPRVYVYRQSFRVGGRARERLATFAALRLVPLDSGEVLPHERTHSGPKKDRLALTLATRAQLSPIFMVARDADGLLYAGEREAVSGPPAATAATPDGIGHDLHVVEGTATGAFLAAAAAHPLLIADGHHRYETALAVTEVLGDEVKAAYLLVCIVSQADPGLEVRPTHRILTRPPGDCELEAFDWPAALAGDFEFEDVEGGSPTALEDAAGNGPAGSFIIVPGGGEGPIRLTSRDAALKRAGIPAERARIAPVVFDELVLRHLYGIEADVASRQSILEYSRWPESAVSVPRGGCGFILPPVSIDDVWTTAARGGRLPPKSTYFEPKMPSGLLFRSL